MKIFLIILLITIIALIIFVIRNSPPKTPESITNIAELEDYFERLVDKNIPPGLSIVVIKKNAVVYSNAFGMADGPNQFPATPDTVYHWWSMTKIPTAIAIIQLSERGKINLDEPVSNYLSFFEVEYPNVNSEEITIRHLLSHTSGLPDLIPALIGWVHYQDEVLYQTDLLIQHLPNYNQIKFEPGSEAAYSNMGYLVLGAVIEAVAGQSYEAYIHEHILQPVGMQNTSFLYSPDLGDNEAFGSQPLINLYTPMLPFLLDMKALISEREGAIWWLKRVYIDVTPSTGLIGSTQEAAMLMQALFGKNDLLSEDSRLSMLPSGSQAEGRPLGWAEYELGDRPWVQHQGGGPGFATIMRLYPQENLGILIMANGTQLNSVQLVELLSSLPWE